MARSCFCDRCEREVVSGGFEFRRHIGMLIMFQHARVSGYFCRECASHYFWTFGAVSFFFGWLGYISIIAAPIVGIYDFVQYLQSRFLPKPDASTAPPAFDEQSLRACMDGLPQLDEYLERQDHDLHRAAAKLAPGMGVRPAQLIAFVLATARGQMFPQAEIVEPAEGFPVIMPGEASATALPASPPREPLPGASQ